MRNSIAIPVQELTQVGQARREAQRLAAGVSEDLTFAGRISLVVTELARNLVNHAGGGQIVLREVREEGGAGLEVLSIDRGKGMRNVAECLRDGYSTAGTPGTGLGAIRRMSDFFDLTTVEGRGTVICTRILITKGSVPKWDIGAVNIPIIGETMCGDAWKSRETPDSLRVMLADGLGHGHYAAEAADAAVAIFLKNAERPTSEILRMMDAALTATRGAAVAVVEIHPANGVVTVAGAGNISVRIINEDGKSRQIASVNGTVGTRGVKIQEFTGKWAPSSMLIMHSDGLTAHWDAETYPGLLHRHPATIAGVLYRDYARGRDDATILTVCHHR